MTLFIVQKFVLVFLAIAYTAMNVAFALSSCVVAETVETQSVFIGEVFPLG